MRTRKREYPDRIAKSSVAFPECPDDDLGITPAISQKRKTKAVIAQNDLIDTSASGISEDFATVVPDPSTSPQVTWPDKRSVFRSADREIPGFVH